jgi:hypothetical protein
MKILAYLIYGDIQEYQLELALSVLSALRFLKQGQESITISVLTDRPDLKFDLPVDRILISPEEFAEWTQGGSYNYRAKVLALMKAIDFYQGPVALVDTDTYFRQSPARLFDRVSPQVSVMHKFEYEICNQPYWQPVVQQLGDGIEIEGVQISPQSPMFNSGVIGVDVSHRSLLDKCLAVLDKVYVLSPIFNVEQFALGVVLNQYTQLSTSADLVWHYWGMNRGFIHVQTARLLQNFTPAKLESVLAELATLPLGAPPKSFQDKAVGRFLGFTKGWDDDYRFAYLSYRCALAYAIQDRDYANVWAKVALGGVKKSIEAEAGTIAPAITNCSRPPATLQGDFRLFNPAHIDRLDWLEPAVKQAWMEFWQT